MISVILPVYNSAPWIGRCVESILAQTFRDFELIIVDDGSTDETPLLLEQFARADQRTRLIREEHRGVTGAFNRGLEEARGEFIARMDADDEMLPQRLEKQIDFLGKNPGTGVVSCLVQHGGHPEMQKGYSVYIDWINTLITPDQIALNRFVEAPVANPSVLFRRALAEQLGSYRHGNFPEDYELWLRWMDAGVRIAKVPEVLLTWNDPPTRLSRTDDRYSDEAFQRAKAGYLAKFIRENLGGRKLWLCGAGRITRQKSALLVAENLPVGGYVDVDPKKIGKQYAGFPVVGIDGIPGKETAYVVSYVANRGAREDIREMLLEKGFAEGADFILAG